MNMVKSAPTRDLTGYLTPSDPARTPRELTDLLSFITGRPYSAIFIHCMVFDDRGRTLMLRHAGKPDLPVYGGHEAWAWCTPWITVESYLPGEIGGASEKSIDEVVRRTLQVHIPALQRLDGNVSILTAVQTPCQLKADGSARSVLILTAGVRMEPHHPIVLYGTPWVDYHWASISNVGRLDCKRGCGALCRKPWFLVAVHRWRTANRRAVKMKLKLGLQEERERNWNGMDAMARRKRMKRWKPRARDV